MKEKRLIKKQLAFGMVCVLVAMLFFIVPIKVSAEEDTYSVQGTDVNVSNQAGWESEVSIDINPRNPNNLVIVGHAPNFATMNTFFTLDGGQTWTLVPLGNAQDGLVSTFRFDPTVAFDENGNVYVGYGVKTLVPTQRTVVVARSTDGGQTYTQFTQVATTPDIGLPGNDKWHLATGPDPLIPTQQNVYIAWTQNIREGGVADQRIVVSGSTDGGATFSLPVIVNDDSISGTDNALFADPAVGPNGEVYVAWHDLNNDRVYIDVSLDGGATFGTDNFVVFSEVGLKTKIPAQPDRGIFIGPTIDVDRSHGPFNGRIYVTYTYNTSTISDTDICVKYSDDSGTTWSGKTYVNDDVGTNSQFLPWLDVDQQTGLVTVVWYDARNDPFNELVEVFISLSSDGGASFQPNILVSDGQSNCSVNNPSRSINNYLEYIGIAAHSLMAHPVWSDNSLDLANLDFFTDNVSLTPVDVYILVDLSGSFFDDLPIFKDQAPGIIAELSASSPNIKFGLGKFEDYPIYPFGSATAGDQAYERLVDLTLDTDDVLNKISELYTRDGGDLPESQLAAMYQAATGAGQDLSGEGFPDASIPAGQQANFRDGAIKLILLWTDAEFHQPGDPGDILYPGPSFEETVTEILALDPPKVIGISSGADAVADLTAIAEATGALAPPGGVDWNDDGIIDILEGDPLVCSIPTTGQGIGDAMVGLTKAAINRPPIANAGPDQVVEQETHAGTQVTLDGSGSFDPDGDQLTYQWTWTGGTSTEEDPTFTFPLGTHTVTLTVSDGETSATDIVGIKVQDTIPPEITVISEPIVFWPPKHKYHTIEISDFITSVTDTCDSNVGIDDIVITSVSSDEPENAKGRGDGNTWNDIIIVDSQTVKLREERQEDGNGRVYTINFEVTDASGNTATGSFQVWVPYTKNSTPIDDGVSEGYIVYYTPPP
jgi:hypothetical protein